MTRGDSDKHLSLPCIGYRRYLAEFFELSLYLNLLNRISLCPLCRFLPELMLLEYPCLNFLLLPSASCQIMIFITYLPPHPWDHRKSPLSNPHNHGSRSPLKNLWYWSWSFPLVHISLIFLCHTGWKICTYKNIMISLRGESALKMAIKWVSGGEKRGKSRQWDRELPAEGRSQVIYSLWSLGIWQENITILWQTFIKHLPCSKYLDDEVWSVNDCLYTFCKGRN